LNWTLEAPRACPRKLSGWPPLATSIRARTAVACADFGNAGWDLALDSGASPYVRNVRGTLTGAMGSYRPRSPLPCHKRSLKDVPKSLHLDHFCLFIAIEFWRSSGWPKNLHRQIIDDAN